jgi:outer membrane protein assembly factor BamD (BamD/ComL family)
MSVSGISGSSFFQAYNTGSVQRNRFQQFQQEFQQLGQDLQSGNLSQAQSDFATLQQNAPSSSSAASSSNPIAQAFSQLSQDLQAGNLSAAQTDYSNIQQDLQQKAAQGAQGHHHHHHHMPTESSQDSSSSGPGSVIDQAFGQLGQDLQSGNLQAAQQAYATLQQDFQQFAALGQASSGSSTSPAASATSGVNFTA